MLLATRAHGAASPLSVAIVPGIQFPTEEYSITGARVSLLFGKHRDVYGLDLGVLGNVTEQSFTGIALSGLFNLTKGTTNIIGLQLAAIANVNTNKARIFGLQLAALNIQTAESAVYGVELGLGNYCPFTSVHGLQLAVFNSAIDVYGIQLGLINRAKSLHGLQIGLVNINETGVFYVAPILNVGF